MPAAVKLLAGAALAVLAPPWLQAQSVSHGQQIFESRCSACHSLDSNRVGPALGSVFGRRAGRAPGFAYSQALASANHSWTQERLLAWLTDPQALVPGQAMGYRVESLEDRRDVVAYLASLSKDTASH